MTTFEGMTEEDQLNALMAELKDSNIRQSVMEYIANKSEVAPGMTDKQRLSKMIETIAAESVTNQKQSALWKSRTKKSILLGIMAVIVAITVQFLVNFFSNELSKESHVTGKGTMVGTDGSVVKTQMDEMRVNADGQLQGRSSVKTIKTTPSLNRIALASSLPDSTLLALDEITVYSDKGHTLRVKVHGFARVPVLNSKCGNLVHFYTAWNGRITLDSTELSFDKATETQFKDAGFSLAVGGFNGRRLAGGSRSLAFFKHVDQMKKSGSWTCADVALPSTVETYMSRESHYHACQEHNCYSEFGGLKLGVAKIPEAHALAAMPVTARMRTLLKGAAAEVFYVKSETTNIVSPSYFLEIATLPAHFGQEKISFTDRENDKTVTFQVTIGDRDAVAFCAASADDDVKTTKKALADKAVDSDVHMEFLGLAEEGGKVLRHWRWWLSASLMKARGGSGSGFAGEYWDLADTLVPYRTLDVEGGVYITESYSAKSTDADVSAALSLRTSASVQDLLACKVDKMDEERVPQMGQVLDELNEVQISYYVWQIFGDSAAAQRTAAAGEEDTLTRVAEYLIRGEKGYSDGSVSDPCYLACKEVMDAADKSEAKGEDQCANGAHKAISECLAAAHTECNKMPWVSINGQDCAETAKADSTANRALEEDEELSNDDSMNSGLVPTGEDGVADLMRTSPNFQAAVAQTLGAEMPKVVVNVTRKLNAHRLNRRLQNKPCWSCEPTCWAKPRAGKSQKKSRCATCNLRNCMYARGYTSIGTTTNMWGWLCLSFSFCLSWHLTVVVYIKMAPISGRWAFSIIVEICVEDYQIAMGIPPPWFMQCCLGGQLHIFFIHYCWDVRPSHKSGGCYLRKSVDMFWERKFFGIKVGFTLSLVTLQVGVDCGSQFHRWAYRGYCWRNDGRRRRRRHRRRWRMRRRRRTRWACHWHWASSCDQYTRWYVTVTFFGFVQLGFECWEWTKAKRKEGYIFFAISVPKGINWRGIKWKWDRFGQFCCFRKYNR